MRGKVRVGGVGWVCVGITPAYAGKSCSAADCVCTVLDHPRLCGEKDTYDDSKSAAAGSPPPMRGKGASWKCLLDCKGITPAYAGKRRKRRNCVQNTGDHPRLCGEKLRSPLWLATKIGSPPPMRGKVIRIYHPKCDLRITPAYAGKRLEKAGYWVGI